MLQAVLVTFREGLESFLIVAVIVGYLRKTGRAALVRGVRIGLVASAFTCFAGAWLWLKVPNQPLYEGIAALTAAVLVGVFLWQMLRVGRQLKAQIEARLDRAAGSAGPAPSWRALAAVALVTTLLVTREGLEAVLYLGVQALAVRKADVATGAALGVTLAGAIAWTWTRYSTRVHMGVLLRVTALFLALFLVQLLVYGIHELAESGVIEGSQAFHDATEQFGPDGTFGQLMSYSLALAPLLYLVWTRRARRPSPPASVGRVSAA